VGAEAKIDTFAGNIRYDSNEYRYKKDNKSNFSKKFKFNNKECDRNDKE